jgi:hypothetical protein
MCPYLSWWHCVTNFVRGHVFTISAGGNVYDLGWWYYVLIFVRGHVFTISAGGNVYDFGVGIVYGFPFVVMYSLFLLVAFCTQFNFM